MPFFLFSCCSSDSVERAHSDDDTKVTTRTHVSSPQISTPKLDTSVQFPQPNGQSSQPLTDGNSSPTSSAPTQQEPARPVTPPPVVPQPAQPPVSSKVQPYTTQRSLALFAKYVDSDNADVIGPEGFERLCMEGGIPLEGALPLILAWQLDGKEMAKITKDEWVKGMGTLKIASLPALATALNDLQNLLIMKQGAVKKSVSKKDQDLYDKTSYHAYAQDPKAAFSKLYTYCFALAKPEGSRNIDMETSCAFWSVLLVPQYPIMRDVLEFLAEKGTYKATNKDLWSMVLEFCETVDPSLEDYEADGAWPTLLDDFVSWQKSKPQA